jgi:hypothetical protein
MAAAALGIADDQTRASRAEDFTLGHLVRVIVESAWTARGFLAGTCMPPIRGRRSRLDFSSAQFRA